MKKAGLWSLYLAIMIIGAVAFLVLCADENPCKPMSDALFFGIKFGALGALYGCAKALDYLGKRGMLPGNENPETNNNQD